MKNMIEEGKAVPKFQLEDADGNLVKSSQLKGQKYVVYFYPRDFTPGCTTAVSYTHLTLPTKA